MQIKFYARERYTVTDYVYQGSMDFTAASCDKETAERLALRFSLAGMDALVCTPHAAFTFTDLGIK